MSPIGPLLVDRPAARVVRLRLDRPDRRNAIDATLLAALRDALDDPDAATVVLGSTDRRAFCAGGDLSLDPASLAEVSDGLYALYEHMLTLPAVIVAAADGHAIGAGAQLLVCADLRVGGPGLQMSFAGAAAGLALGTWGLPGLVGRGRALDLSLTGRCVGSDEALRIGLIDRCVDDPDAAALALAADLASAERDVVTRVKRLVVGRTDPVAGVRAERAANAASFHTQAGTRRPRSGDGR